MLVLWCDQRRFDDTDEPDRHATEACVYVDAAHLTHDNARAMNKNA